MCECFEQLLCSNKEMCDAFLDLCYLLVRLLSKVSIIQARSTKQPRSYTGQVGLLGKLTFRLRDECDLAEPEEVRGAVLDTATEVMLVFAELVG